jgi:hypothetical protein
MGEVVMIKLRLGVLLLLALPLASQADALFGNSLAGDQKLPRAWGVGVDYFGMRLIRAWRTWILANCSFRIQVSCRSKMR